MPKTKALEDMVCYMCSKKGHLQYNCPIEAYVWKNSGKRVGGRESHTGGNQTNPHEEKDKQPAGSKDKRCKHKRQFYCIEEAQMLDDGGPDSDTSSVAGKGSQV